MTSSSSSSVVIVCACALIHTISGQFTISGQSSSSQSQSQYPRIKIGGPLGQLIPNGFQLGAGLGSVINSLIGSTDTSGGGGHHSSGHHHHHHHHQPQLSSSSSSSNSPFAAPSLRSPYLTASSSSSTGQQMSPQQQQTAFSSLYSGGSPLLSSASSSSPSSALYSALYASSDNINKYMTSPFSQLSHNFYNSDGMYSMSGSSSPLAVASQPPSFGNHPSVLYSPNSHSLNAQLLGID